jgi:hypothetical protein
MAGPAKNPSITAASPSGVNPMQVHRDANPNTRRGKALLILPYFGSYGPWFPLYLHSLANQQTLDLLLVSDSKPPALPPNARRVEMTFDQLRERAAARLGTPVRLQRMRNICDLRPAYGLVFEEFIDGYGYWAFGDEDVLYGDLDRMLAPALDGAADLVIPGTTGKSGHLTVLKNDPRTNALAMNDPAYKDVLVSIEHWAYDETSWRCGTEVSSFHAIVTAGEARGELSVRRGLPRVVNVPAPGRSYVYDGRTLREDTGRELLYYHWGRMRHRNVQWPDAEEAKRGFAFDRYGFYDPKLEGARLVMRRGVGRAREFASAARRRLSDWRAAKRAAISAPPQRV